MTETSPPLTHRDETALKALIAWWEEAGVELDLPATRPRAGPKPPLAAGAPAERPPERRATAAEPARTATAAAARAAGFGGASDEGPGARELAARAETLEALRTAIGEFEACPLRRTARNTVFSRGNPAAKVMIVGEAPGKEEDEQGQPFVGRSGQLLDRMFAAIGLGPEDFYVSNILNWRPPGNRAPTQDEIVMCLPFIERHIALKAPDVLVLAGGISAQTLLRSPAGITRLRGRWTEYALRDATGEPTDRTVPVLPMFHPAYLLRRPAEKRLAWQDMLALQAKLTGE